MVHRSHKTPRGGEERSQRQLRVGELLRHALVEALARGELRDPVLQDVPVTVSEVQVSADLRNATAFVMPLGGAQAAEVVAALRRAGPYLRRLVGHGLTIRHVPNLSFELDTAFDRSQRIEALLRSDEVARDTGRDDPDSGDDGA